jgi:hypothetical protein
MIKISTEPANPVYVGVSVDPSNDTLWVGINNARNNYGVPSASTLNGTVVATTSRATGGIGVTANNNTMLTLSDCGGQIVGYTPATSASATRVLNSSAPVFCYEAAWFLP